ncbi:hypothetical protein BDV96DRAFT_653888 [Lophiotrema nucula]|uniref:Mid2 domain-containing protein n=1 Tax=Lophiotrema nucula TaxID=690887 RepID=A0A6A5YLU1_9PLEO|nr:hypothetical protein BDV96DRAFT_653888 [Lophiotrema nucula]
MRFDSLTAALAVSNVWLGAFAGPLVAKRQDGTTSASSSAPTVGLAVSTMSNGKPTTFEAIAPQPSATDASEATTSTAEASATGTAEASTTTATVSKTGQAPPPSTAFPMCHDANAKPFCLPNNMSTLYIDKTYYATWNPDNFPINSTVTIKIQYFNDSLQEAWSSDQTDNSWGFVAFTTKKEWLQGYSQYNLTFTALNFEATDPAKQADAIEGPLITLTNEPPNHYTPPEHTKTPNKEGLMIGLPVALGFVLLVVIGLWFGMRKHRTIGLGNIMGRRNKGYGVGKSRRQRLGLGKKGAIRLEEQRAPTYRNAPQPQPAHARGDSLGSLVSDDEIQPAPRGNQFRDEIQRQRTGR